MNERTCKSVDRPAEGRSSRRATATPRGGSWEGSPWQNAGL